MTVSELRQKLLVYPENAEVKIRFINEYEIDNDAIHHLYFESDSIQPTSDSKSYLYLVGENISWMFGGDILDKQENL